MPKKILRKSLYIPQNGKDYAIAYSNKHGEVPMNFKAIEDGQYTISVNPEGVEMAYLHLIDNLTGRVVASYNATNRIGTDGMVAGVYVLRLINGDNVKTQKIVK